MPFSYRHFELGWIVEMVLNEVLIMWNIWALLNQVHIFCPFVDASDRVYYMFKCTLNSRIERCHEWNLGDLEYKGIVKQDAWFLHFVDASDIVYSMFKDTLNRTCFFSFHWFHWWYDVLHVKIHFDLDLIEEMLLNEILTM